MKRTKIKAGTVIATVLATLLPASCDINEGIGPCPTGLELKFVFDYNMEYADAFPAKVDCYTLYVYDSLGNHVRTCTETGPRLRDPDYRLKLDLPHGRYRLLAYGGMACRNRSFSPVEEPVPGSSIGDLEIRMQKDGEISERRLHGFYYGYLEAEVPQELYRDTTLALMCNTNNIRILLQQLDGTPVPVGEFTFAIDDDNTVFHADNRPVPGGKVTYLPWATGLTGQETQDSGKMQAAYAEFSTSRLWKGNRNSLVIRNAGHGGKVLDVPLNATLLLLKSERYSQMGSQEFLDRQSDWSIVFFLDSRYKWLDTRIIVNGWTVRINDIGH